MGRTATVHLFPLRSCLCNLPLSLHAPLSQRAVAPQSVAVQLTFRPDAHRDAPPVQLCLGWTGLPASPAPVAVSQPRHAQPQTLDRIEIDPQFAQLLHPALTEGVTVSIELLRDLPVATTVDVTPSSADDWEILEANAEFVEMYLLNQVRAVKEGMTVGCWVGASLIRFVVDSTTPSASTAVLLTSTTELIVAPKSRHLPSSAPSSSKTHDLSGPSSSASAPASSAATAEWGLLRRKLLRLPPTSHPSPLSDPSAAAPSPPPDALVVHPALARALVRAFPAGKITVSHFARPKERTGADEAAGGGTQAAGPGAGDVQPHAFAPPPSAPTPAGAGPPDKALEAVEVAVVASERVPPGHAWVGERVRDELFGLSSAAGGAGKKGTEGLGRRDGAFELLRLGAPLTSQARKARAAAAKDKEREREQAPSPTVGSPTSTSRPSLHQKLPPPSRAHLANGDSSSALSPTTNGAPSASSPQIETLAGIDRPLTALTSHIVHSHSARTLCNRSAASSAGAIPGVLVTGASGAGKTALVKEAARRMSADERVLSHTVYVDCAQHADARLPTLKGRIKDWLDEAGWHAPSVLVLDNLDRMIGAEVEHADSFPTVHLANTFLSLASAALVSRPIVLVATAQGSTSLHPLLQSTHLLGETVSLRGPDKTARRDIINVLVQAKTAASDLTAPQLNCASIAAITEGYLPADLRDLVDRAVQQAAIRSLPSSSSAAAPSSDGLVLTADDFHAAQQGFVPLSLRDVKLQKSDVAWADIGGLHDARKTLRETLEWPTKYGAIFASCPLRLRSGLLLYGYPGCGKTLLASAVAKECGLNFISVKGPEILNKYIGASEKSVRDLFERAQAAKPCVLFFDEFDSIAPKRGHDSTGVTDRVVNQMLTQMDGAEGLDGVYVLAATSRPDLIDPALLRPGRLDKSILCDMPNEQDRLEIMQSAARKIHLSSSVSLSTFAAQTAGYSGADLQALVYNAHLDAVHATIASKVDEEGKVDGAASGTGAEDDEVRYVAIGGKEGKEGKVLSRAEQATVNKRLELIVASLKEANLSKSKKGSAQAGSATPAKRATTYVDDAHLQKSLQTTRPSVPAEELARLRRIYTEFVSGRSAGGLPSGEASDEVGGRASLM
ncbi:AAA family ATPase peroxin 1 [Rhodotorula paludigena]|uniref:AAA family ATPase peroxin 1 n=1 Tax=Rhodotorula paludigena TaxID=86838 RepID=UPI00316BF74A